MNGDDAARSVAPADSPRRLRVLEDQRKGAKFAALDHDVARVLGPQRGAATIYGFLASSWFEFADPARLNGLKRRPGDWVEVDYRQMMEITGTRAKASVTRWVRILAEDTHACPWSRCADEHPLIVVHRQGSNRPNRYRKWQCGQDTLVLRPRVQSARLREAARKRLAAGMRLNGIVEEATVASIDSIDPDTQLDLLNPEALQQGFRNVNRKSYDKASGSLIVSTPEALQLGFRKPYGKASLRGIVENNKAAEKDEAAAAIREIDDVESVAAEVAADVLALARRRETNYSETQAWDVANRLAEAILAGGSTRAKARAMLRAAIDDRRVAAARNPIGILISGVVGDQNGDDRFLLAAGDPRIARDLPRPAIAVVSTEPPRPRPAGPESGEGEGERRVRCDELHARDPASYAAALDRILASVELPTFWPRSLASLPTLAVCRSRLEDQLAKGSPMPTDDPAPEMDKATLLRLQGEHFARLRAELGVTIPDEIAVEVAADWPKDDHV